MGRAPCCDKVGLNRGRWTAAEDEILISYIRQKGETGSWRSLPKNAGLLRCGKSCRLRWINYLRSDLKRGNFTSHEQHLIIKLQASMGNKWSMIANQLPGRTDNEIKNYWNSTLRRRFATVTGPSMAQVLPQITISNLASKGRTQGQEMSGYESLSAGAAVVQGINVKKRKGRTSRAAMKKNKRVTNGKSNKYPPYESNSIHSSSYKHGISLSHDHVTSAAISPSMLTIPQNPNVEKNVFLSPSDNQRAWSGLCSEDALESIVLDSLLSCRNDCSQRSIHENELVGSEAYSESTDLSFDGMVTFGDELVGVDALSTVQYSGSSSNNDKNNNKNSVAEEDKEKTTEASLSGSSKQAVDNTHQSMAGFEGSSALSAGWDWENTLLQDDYQNQLYWNISERDEPIAWLWEYVNYQAQGNYGEAP